jgi:hypothetical protein
VAVVELVELLVMLEHKVTVVNQEPMALVVVVVLVELQVLLEHKVTVVNQELTV